MHTCTLKPVNVFRHVAYSLFQKPFKNSVFIERKGTTLTTEGVVVTKTKKAVTNMVTDAIQVAHRAAPGLLICHCPIA